MVNPRYSRPTPNNKYCDDELYLDYEDYGLFDDEYLEVDDGGLNDDVADGVDIDEDDGVENIDEDDGVENIDEDDGEEDYDDDIEGAVVYDGYDEDVADDDGGVVADSVVVDDENNSSLFGNYLETFQFPIDEFQTPTRSIVDALQTPSSTDTLQISLDADNVDNQIETHNVDNPIETHNVDNPFFDPTYTSYQEDSVIIPPERIEEMVSGLTEEDVADFNLFGDMSPDENSEQPIETHNDVDNPFVDIFDNNYIGEASSVIVPPEIIFFLFYFFFVD